MKTFWFWLRWLSVLPLVVVVYGVVQMLVLVVGVGYMQDWIVGDDSGGYEVSSHLLWDWICRPLAFGGVGLVSAVYGLKVAGMVAPTWKVQVVRVMAALMFLWALSNVVFGVLRVHEVAGYETVSGLACNVAVGIVGLLAALRLKTASTLL